MVSGKDIISGKKHTDRREVLESQGQRSLRPIFRSAWRYAVLSAVNLAAAHLWLMLLEDGVVSPNRRYFR
jgi:hypothetical protein